jgi:hypothetical protein
MSRTKCRLTNFLPAADKRAKSCRCSNRHEEGNEKCGDLFAGNADAKTLTTFGTPTLDYQATIF